MITVNIVTTCICVFCAVVNWQARKSSKLRKVAYISSLVLVWNLSIISLIAIRQEQYLLPAYTFKKILSNFSLAVVLIFTIDHFRSFLWLNRYGTRLIWGIFFLQTALVLTNPLHHLFWTGYSVQRSDSLVLLSLILGPVGQGSDLVNIGYIALALSLLLYESFHQKGRERVSAIWFAISSLLVLLTMVVSNHMGDRTFMAFIAPIGLTFGILLLTFVTFNDVILELMERTTDLDAMVGRLGDEINQNKILERELLESRGVLSNRLADQSRKLMGLYDLMVLGDEKHPVDDLLGLLVKQLLVILECDNIAFFPVYPPKPGRGTPSVEHLHTVIGIDVGEGFARDGVIEEIIGKYENGQMEMPEFVSGDLQTCLFQKIEFEGRELGMMAYVWPAQHEFKVDEIALVSGVTNLSGIMLENERLSSLKQEAARNQERRRLAQDLHDSVTQSLHSLVFSAETAMRVYQKKPQQVPELLKHLTTSSAQALKEMRLLLYEMRWIPLQEIHFLEAVEQRLETVERRAGVDAVLAVEGSPGWPKEWEMELYPIAMEALNNSIKHGHGKKMWVCISQDEEVFQMSIRDDGKGMIVGALKPGGMGLSSMQERAKRLGGELTIHSQPDLGTEVVLRIQNRVDLSLRNPSIKAAL